jgi:hypothetical protein
MATPRKGSTTPKDLKDDAGGLVAGGGPDLSGTAMPPAKPASARARSKSTEGVDTAGARKGAASDKTAAKSRSRAGGATAKGAAPGKSVGPSTADPGAGQSPAGPEAGGDARTAGGTVETVTSTDGHGRVSDEERQRRIAEAAYRKAQERGFTGDRQLDDWLEAEREHNEAQRRSG